MATHMQTTISISLPTSEVDARLENPIHKTKVNEIVSSLDVNLTPTFMRLQKLISFPDSAIGLISAGKEILRDIREAKKIGYDFGEWDTVLERIIVAVVEFTGGDEASDRKLAIGLANTTIKFFLSLPDKGYSAADKSKLRAIRGILSIHALSMNQSSSYFPIVLQLFSGRILFNRQFVNQFNFDQEFMRTARSEMEINSDLAKLLTLLLTALSGHLSEIPKPVPIIQHHDQQTEANLDKERSLSDVDRETYVQPSSEGQENFLGYLLRQMPNITSRASNGIGVSFKHVGARELEIILPEIVKDLSCPDKNKYAIASILTLLLRCRPSKMNMIPLTLVGTEPIWLDVQNGHLCWVLEPVVKKFYAVEILDSYRVVRIPLPIEVVKVLKALRACKPDAKRLGDLFGTDSDIQELDKDTKKYVKTKSITSHRLSLSRLEISYGPFVLSHCFDEVYAAAISMDFALGTTSNFSYAVLRGDRVQEILNDAYLRLGFKEKITIHLDDVGSNVGFRKDETLELVKSCLMDAHAAYGHLGKNISLERLINTHNQISELILTALVILTGCRAADEFSFTCHTIDLDSRLILICDKRVSDYLWSRIVPVPNVVIKWLQFYIAWLESLRYRFLRINRDISISIDRVINSGNAGASAALFFHLTPDGSYTLGSKNIAYIFDKVRLPTNCGRHLIDALLREAGLDSATIMAAQGHANFGQESFGCRSAMIPMQAMKIAREALDAALAELNIQYPPNLKSRSSGAFTYSAHFSALPGLLGQPFKTIDSEAEPCPFNENTLWLANKFNNLKKDWLQSSPDFNLGNLAVSLVFLSGVNHESELLNAIDQLLIGDVYKLGDRYFVDTNNNELGIRRVWLNPISVRLAAFLSQKKNVAITRDEVERSIKQLGFEKPPNIGKDFIEFFLKLGLSASTLYFPSAIRAWQGGQIVSRTTRHEALARKFFNCIEYPKFSTAVSRTRSNVSGDKLFRSELISAADLTQYLGTNQTRRNRLAKNISEYLRENHVSFVVETLGKFIVYLCEVVDAPSTILRYYSPISKLLSHLPSHVEYFEELSIQKWDQITELWLRTESNEDGSPAIAALNHFLKFLGLDENKRVPVDKIAPARKYCDFPSHEEIKRAILITSTMNLFAEIRKDQPGLVLGLLSLNAIRPGELQKIRLSDVHILDPYPHIVITSETVGSTKTKNAQRVIYLDDENAAEVLTMLRRLYQIRKEQLPNNGDGFLFGDTQKGLSSKEADEIFHVALTSLRLVTGASEISLRNFRQYIITTKFRDELSPKNQNSIGLNRRQQLEIISARSGHGDSVTSFLHYFSDMDVLRWEWMEYIHEKYPIRPSSCFASTLTGISNDVYRKRKQRGRTIDFDDVLEKFMPDDYPSFQLRVVDLKGLVIPEVEVVDYLQDDSRVNSKTVYAIYLASLLCGRSQDVAEYESQICINSRIRIDKGLEMMCSSVNYNWAAKSKFDKRSVLHSKEYQHLTTIFSGIEFSESEILRFCRAFPQRLESSWAFDSYEAYLMLLELKPKFEIAEIDIQVSFKSPPDFDVRRKASFSKVEIIKLRNSAFPTGKIILVSFVPMRTDCKNRPHKLPRTMFQISTIFLSIFAFQLGGICEK